jgi:glutaredoxin 3
MEKVLLYTTEPCARCGNAKALLAQHGIDYEEVNLSKDPVGRTELARRTGLMTFPQVVIGGRTLGGLDDLRAAVDDGRLSELV